MQSIIAVKKEQHKKALSILSEAIDLALPGRTLLPFMEGGEAIPNLLAQLPRKREWGSFVSELQEQFHSSPAKEGHQPLIEPLTNREQDVLELLAERMYDKEIAANLMISVDTVKTHLKHIYGKLQVPNRREAARKAKDLGLLV